MVAAVEGAIALEALETTELTAPAELEEGAGAGAEGTAEETAMGLETATAGEEEAGVTTTEEGATAEDDSASLAEEEAGAEGAGATVVPLGTVCPGQKLAIH